MTELTAQNTPRTARLLAALTLPLLAVVAVLCSLPNSAARDVEGTQQAVRADDFYQAAPQGLSGRRANGRAWSMVWWNDRLYVGTTHNLACMRALAQNRFLLGLIPYPPLDPDLLCPADPLDIDARAEIWRWTPETDIWERIYQSPTMIVTSYTRLTGTLGLPTITRHLAPMREFQVALDTGYTYYDYRDSSMQVSSLYTETVPISETEVARDVGYRGMVIVEEEDGTEALYVTGANAQFAGYPVPPPRILRSSDGQSFSPLPQDPGTVLGELGATGLNAPFLHTGTDGVKRMYVIAARLWGDRVLLEAEQPREGNDAFRPVSAPEMRVSAAASYNGHLYVGLLDPIAGFSVIKMNADGGAAPYAYQTVISDGGDAPIPQPNIEIVSMQEFDGRLYLGGNGVGLDIANRSFVGAELFRINPDDTWDVVVGNARLLPLEAPKLPLSTYGPGFHNQFNWIILKMAVHQGALFVTTLDASTLAKDITRSPLVRGVMGFDLYRTTDGVHFDRITIDGLSDQIDDVVSPRPDLNRGALDAAVESISSTPAGLFLGTSNSWYGLRIWRNSSPPHPVAGDLYLPLVVRAPSLVNGIDLVVRDLVATSTAVTVTIANQGQFPVVDAFWVDVYFDPTVVPRINRPWDTIAGHGVVWGVTDPVPPGGSLTLTIGGRYYSAKYSSPLPLPVGAQVYALVDSINYDTTFGAIQESNEDNNLYGPVISTPGASVQTQNVLYAPLPSIELPGR